MGLFTRLKQSGNYLFRLYNKFGENDDKNDVPRDVLDCLNKTNDVACYCFLLQIYDEMQNIT